MEELIRAGRVRVDGRMAELGQRVEPARARITVDGTPVPADPDLRYFALNKPAGVTTTMRDPHAERSIAGYLPPGPRIFPVGRLDRESEGLLLLTNDGELSHRLQHPRYGVEKEYLVEVEGSLSRQTLRTLAAGVKLVDGIARPRRIGRVDRVGRRSALTLVMGEGRKREVRRMLEAVGHRVLRLVRVRIGPVRLSNLREGQSRPLSPGEIAELYGAVGLEHASRSSPRPRRAEG